MLVDRLLDTFEAVPVGNSLPLYASIKADLVCSGTPIEDFDLLIGCTALANSFVLVSGNLAHMSRIKGLSLEDWIYGQNSSLPLFPTIGMQETNNKYFYVFLCYGSIDAYLILLFRHSINEDIE